MDLYVERDHTKWYWRTAAIASAALIMIGYAASDENSSSSKLTIFPRFLIFPASFPNNTSDALSSRGSDIVAGVLLAIGYVLAAVLSVVCKSWLFRLDVIYV